MNNTYWSGKLEKVQGLLSVASSLDVSRNNLPATVSHLLTKLLGKEEIIRNLSKIDAALSNTIFVVKLLNSEDKLILRVYPNDQLLDRIREVYVSCMLGRLGIAPKVIGLFENGRFEQYVEHEIVTAKEIRLISRYTAQLLANMHRVEIQESATSKSEIWARLLKWYQTAKACYEPTNREDDEFNLLDEEYWLSEFEIVKQKLRRSQVVLCHNDAQYLNILKVNSEKYMLIDCEYACFNHRGFDLGSHLWEWTTDYMATDSTKRHLINDEMYPTVEEENRFLSCYLTEWNTLEEQNLLSISGKGSALGSTVVIGQNVCPTELQSLYQESRAGGMAAHLMWLMWSLVHARKTDSDFDYIGHARERYRVYNKYKEAFLVLKKQQNKN